MLLLWKRVLAEACNELEKLRRFAVFETFVGLIVAELHSKWTFVMRDIVYTILQHLSRLACCNNKYALIGSNFLCFNVDG